MEETAEDALEILHSFAIEHCTGGTAEMTRLSRIVSARLSALDAEKVKLREALGSLIEEVSDWSKGPRPPLQLECNVEDDVLSGYRILLKEGP